MKIQDSTYVFLIMVILLIISSCSQDQELIEESSNEGSKIQEQYRPYVDRFIDEAVKRKVNVNDSRLYVITGFPRLDVCGFGYYNYLGNGSMRVEISPEPSCWANRNDLEREILMFHELGHAILNRQHKEGNFSISNPTSIMCSETCNGFFNLYNKFTPKVRDYYIDELFDPLKDSPSWVTKTESTIVIEDKINDQSDNWKFFSSFDSSGIFTSDGLDTIGSDNFALSITSTNPSADNTFSFWRRTIENPQYPIGSGLKLSIDITTENLAGNGVSIALRTDSKENEELMISSFQTTQGRTTLNGNLENKTVSVNIGYFPEKVENIHIFLLMLNKTEGKAYFDNIKLELLE